jgi:hypothetical protein
MSENIKVLKMNPMLMDKNIEVFKRWAIGVPLGTNRRPSRGAWTRTIGSFLE